MMALPKTSPPKKRNFLRHLTTFLFALITVTCHGAPADPQDWLFCRGPEFNGVSRATGTVDDFDPAGGQGSNVAWKRDDLGGRSSVIVMNGRAYTLCRANPGTSEEGERVVCVNAVTGETIWENSFNVYLSDVPDTRVGWSAVTADAETNAIFALGVCGIFQCIDADTGQTRWSVPMHERFGLLSTYGGRTNFPIIVDDLVIVSAVCINWGIKAKPAHAFVAYDKRTGEVVWFQGTRIGPYDTTYSVPTLAWLNNQRSLVFGSGDGAIWSFQPLTGRPLWKVALSRRGVNTPPLVAGNHVFACQSEENIQGTTMGAVVSIDTTRAGDLRPADSFAKATDLTESGVEWKVEELMAGRAQPLLIGNRLWIVDDRGKLHILDAQTGEPVAKRIALGRMMRASLLYADGKVYAFEANGRWAIYRPDDKRGAKVVNKGRMPRGEEVHGSPTCAHGRIYVQSNDAIYCLHDPNKKSGFTGLPDRPANTSQTSTAALDYLQLVPADVLVRPGRVQQFQVRGFDVDGRPVSVPPGVQFEIDQSVGSIDKDGKFTAADTAAHQAATVTARVAGRAGRSRIRVVPDLPWSFTFDDGQVPVTWVGARYRHVALDDDLLASLEIMNPTAAQLYIYLHSAFVNSGVPRQVFDNSTPRQRWTQFQRFLGIDSKDLEAAKAAVDPALAVLVDQGVLAQRRWEQVPEIGVRLTVAKGPRMIEGNGVMTKITTIPKGTRSRCWFGHSDLHDYTIQVDVRAATKEEKLPDIGIIAQGYALDLQGANQDLEIRTWVTQRRMAQSIPFPWEANRWYTMKFQASVEGDKAILRGKVWPKGSTEPTDWTLKAEDASPNRHGSPGLYGNAKDAEIFLDNIRVFEH
ncbi:MAG: pyrrolo-quinoline quinone [Planctomycetaceae bacterium]|nr:pyrrolo-quinoline quinone [Planctomycetaceae bacterium]